jgi:hypothetical protein
MANNRTESILNLVTKKLHLADIQGAMVRVNSLAERHNEFEIVLHVNRLGRKGDPMVTEGRWNAILVSVGDMPP